MNGKRKIDLEKLVECRTCHKMFDPKAKKKIRGGFINECPTCSIEDSETKYLGRLGGPHKGAMIEIFRSNLKTVKSVLRVEAARGPTANLSLSNCANTQIREAEKESGELWKEKKED